MKGPVPSHEPIKNNGREQLSIDLSRTLAWEDDRVEPEIRDAVILPRSFSWDWGRRLGDGIGQWVCRKGGSAEWRSPVQHFGSWGRTPVQRLNHHG